MIYRRSLERPVHVVAERELNPKLRMEEEEEEEEEEEDDDDDDDDDIILCIYLTVLS